MKAHTSGRRLAGTRRRIHRGGLLAAPVAAALVIAACGSSSSSTNSTASSSATTAASSVSTTAASSGSSIVSTATAALTPFLALPDKINITTPLKTAPPKGKTIVFLGTTNPSNVLGQQGVQKLAAVAGWNYSEVTYDAANPGTLTSAITTALAKHPNYLVETGTPMTASQLATIKAGGAKLVLNSVFPMTYVAPIIGGTDGPAQDEIMGKLVANYFISDSGGKGDAVIEHIPSYPILDAFVTEFQAQVKAACPDCKTSVTNITIPQAVAGQIPSALTSALRANSSANYLVFDDGPFADGITSALASAGLSSKVKVIGEAADTAGIAALKAGTEQAWTGFDPGYQAYEDMDMMFRDAEGMAIPTALEATQPTQLLTKATIGSTTNWTAPLDAESQFETLWKLK